MHNPVQERNIRDSNMIDEQHDVAYSSTTTTTTSNPLSTPNNTIGAGAAESSRLMMQHHQDGNLGPLSPFTGYATILKSSTFLKVAQNLLDGLFCSPKCDVSETEAASKGSNYSCSSSSLRSDYQQNKANLVFMQEEVNMQYKQFHQQMQMVFSSFETVAGLNSATPYINLALKSVSKHFKCLNNAISNQLKLISEVLRNDSSMPTTTNSTKPVDTNNVPSLRCMDQSLQKNKPDKKSLPVRAVAILRTWLFEHFLHPYPTETDKQVLASQTGLSRNQVSNWFVNARVRVWKPMVEEVLMLEKKSTRASENSSPNERTCGTEVGSCSQPRMDMALSKFVMHSIPENQIQGMEYGSSIDTNAEESEFNEAEQWSREKRLKLECGMSSRMDGTLMEFLPYRNSGHEPESIPAISSDSEPEEPLSIIPLSTLLPENTEAKSSETPLLSQSESIVKNAPLQTSSAENRSTQPPVNSKRRSTFKFNFKLWNSEPIDEPSDKLTKAEFRKLQAELEADMEIQNKRLDDMGKEKDELSAIYMVMKESLSKILAILKDIHSRIP